MWPCSNLAHCCFTKAIILVGCVLCVFQNLCITGRFTQALPKYKHPCVRNVITIWNTWASDFILEPRRKRRDSSFAASPCKNHSIMRIAMCISVSHQTFYSSWLDVYTNYRYTFMISGVSYTVQQFCCIFWSVCASYAILFKHQISHFTQTYVSRVHADIIVIAVVLAATIKMMSSCALDTYAVNGIHAQLYGGVHSNLAQYP